MKIVNIKSRSEKFQQNFRKEMTNNNTKSHKKPELHPLSRKFFFGEQTTGGGQIDLTPVLEFLF